METLSFSWRRYFWDTGDHVIERIKISTALVITLLMTTTVSIYGWRIHRRLEDILDAASLEAPIDDYDYVLSTKNVLGQGASPTLPLPLPPPSVRSYHGACCLRSKMLETLVGLQLVAGFIFVLQVNIYIFKSPLLTYPSATRSIPSFASRPKTSRLSRAS